MKGLNEKKAKALELMIKGIPISHIADEIMVHRTTIYQWIRTDESFKKAKKEAEEQLLENMWLVSMYEIEDVLLNTTDDYKKIQIFTQLSKIKGKEESTLNINKFKSVDEMIKEIKK